MYQPIREQSEVAEVVEVVLTVERQVWNVVIVVLMLPSLYGRVQTGTHHIAKEW